MTAVISIISKTASGQVLPEAQRKIRLWRINVVAAFKSLIYYAAQNESGGVDGANVAFIYLRKSTYARKKRKLQTSLKTVVSQEVEEYHLSVKIQREHPVPIDQF